jgi:hypothetical protein
VIARSYLAIYAITGWLVVLFGYGILMELYELLSLECSGEQLVGFDVLVEYPMPCGIRAPGTIEGVLGLQADQVGRVIGTILGGHQLLDCIGVPTGILQPFYELLRSYAMLGFGHVLGVLQRIIGLKELQVVIALRISGLLGIVWRG